MNLQSAILSQLGTCILFRATEQNRTDISSIPRTCNRPLYYSCIKANLYYISDLHNPGFRSIILPSFEGMTLHEDCITIGVFHVGITGFTIIEVCCINCNFKYTYNFSFVGQPDTSERFHITYATAHSHTRLLQSYWQGPIYIMLLGRGFAMVPCRGVEPLSSDP